LDTMQWLLLAAAAAGALALISPRFKAVYDKWKAATGGGLVNNPDLMKLIEALLGNKKPLAEQTTQEASARDMARFAMLTSWRDELSVLPEDENIKNLKTAINGVIQRAFTTDRASILNAVNTAPAAKG